jgi:SnoaL-like domain
MNLHAEQVRLKASILTVAVFVLGAITAGTAVATGMFQGNNTDPRVEEAAAIVGIEQLLSNYTAYADWGPDNIAPKGELVPLVIGNLFTPTGLWQVGYWNAGNPVVCGTAVGPVGLEHYWGGPTEADSARTATGSHHNLQNVQVMLDPGNKSATVRATQAITVGIPNSTNTSGTASLVLTGRYYGKVVLTSQGWKFQRWFAIEDQPSPLGAPTYGVPNEAAGGATTPQVPCPAGAA